MSLSLAILTKVIYSFIYLGNLQVKFQLLSTTYNFTRSLQSLLPRP